MSYQSRVIEEKAALDAKLEALTNFLASEKVREVPIEERELLRRQASFMANYSDTLGRRIALWS